MATVVITFFLFVRFYDCKMDADSTERRRERNTSRQDRWSMNSQRLEQIVAELMKPIGDIRRSFDMDLSGLLEEYLTEAGVHALEASEREGGDPVLTTNFTELALVLQHSATLYSRKVDFLYQHVLSVSDSLHLHTADDEPEPEGEAPGGEGSAGHAARRRRRASLAAADFLPIELEASRAATREPETRVPPTLARQYVELEPRPTALWERSLSDYRGDDIGLPGDFLVTMRLQNGLLVEELCASAGERSAPLRAISLHELQAAILAHCEPACPALLAAPLASPGSPPASPPPHCSTPLRPPPPALGRKRKNESCADVVMAGSLRLSVTEELRVWLRASCEFSVCGRWAARVVWRRTRRLLHHRHKIRKRNYHEEFRGFDMCGMDIGGFAGWSRGAGGAAGAAVQSAGAGAGGLTADDSDDDGFFEQSSLGDSDTSRVDDERYQEGSSRAGLDIRSIAERVLAACVCPPATPPPAPAPAPPPATPAPPPATPAPLSCDELLARAAPTPRDVSTVLLATLFLANAGNVEIACGAALSMNTFSVRLLSTDPALYSAAAAAGDPASLASPASLSSPSAPSALPALPALPATAKRRRR